MRAILNVHAVRRFPTPGPSIYVEVDCQKQQTYCLRLHFLNFALAILFTQCLVNSCQIILKVPKRQRNL